MYLLLYLWICRELEEPSYIVFQVYFVVCSTGVMFMCITLTCCFGRCYVYSLCFVSYVSLRCCICIYICGVLDFLSSSMLLFLKCVFGYILYVICRCVLYWGGVLFCVVYGVGVLWAISLYDIVLAFIFRMCWGFQGLLHINSFTCVVRVWIICDKSIFLILRCCFVMCCVWSRCFVSYLSLWWCICFYICGFVGSWKNLGILFFRWYMFIP